jgi:ribosomal protein S18 acetylase RimI-like enzyme
VIVREAQSSEAARVYAITRSAFLEYASDVPPPSALFESENDVINELSSGKCLALLAERDGKPLGCVRFEVSQKNGLHFMRLAVLPSARRQGVAKTLLAALETRTTEQQLARIWCHVRPSVRRNVALYETLGFVQNGTDMIVRNGFVISVEVMEKWL